VTIPATRASVADAFAGDARRGFPFYMADASFVSMTVLIVWRENGKGFARSEHFNPTRRR
jgi:hypothetical protein